jgi:hypothetical protein
MPNPNMDKLNVVLYLMPAVLWKPGYTYIGRVSKESTIYPGQRWDAPTIMIINLYYLFPNLGSFAAL